MTTKTWNAELSQKEMEEFPELLNKVICEFQLEVTRINTLWENDLIISVLSEQDTKLPYYCDYLSKQSDALIVQVIYAVYLHFDCVECLKETKHPFINKITKLYHKSRSNLILQQNND